MLQVISYLGIPFVSRSIRIRLQDKLEGWFFEILLPRVSCRTIRCIGNANHGWICIRMEYATGTSLRAYKSVSSDGFARDRIHAYNAGTNFCQVHYLRYGGRISTRITATLFHQRDTLRIFENKTNGIKPILPHCHTNEASGRFSEPFRDWKRVQRKWTFYFS